MSRCVVVTFVSAISFLLLAVFVIGWALTERAMNRNYRDGGFGDG